MKSSEIKKELFQPWELQFLTELDVELGPNYLTFHRQLNDTDMKQILWILLSAKDRTGGEDSPINFALGDYMNQAEEWFGESATDALASEILMSLEYRNRVLAIIPPTNIRLQGLEAQIKICCAVLSLNIKGHRLSVTDLQSTNNKSSKLTLGQLARSLKDSKILPPNVQSRLDSLVANRNRFTHNLFTHDLLIKQSTSFPSLEELKTKERFISDLLKEATELQSIFNKLYLEIGRKIAERENLVEGFLNNSLYASLSKDKGA